MLRAIIFDLDGTITKFNLDINALKREILGEGYEGTLLNGIDELEGEERRRAEDILKRHEISAAHESELNDGVEKLLDFLKEKKIKTALVTRNNRRVVEITCKRFGLEFDVVVSREDAPPKPSRDQLDEAVRGLNLSKDEIIFIGDHPFDLEAGKKVGIKTGLVKNNFSLRVLEEADFVVRRMDEVIGLVENSVH
ncbi:MAG: HAD family hydrolase [Candidatus Hydrothermarchaeales archaeon]